MLSLYSTSDDFLSLSIREFFAFHKNDTLSQIQLLPSLKLLPMLRMWWMRISFCIAPDVAVS